MKLSPSNGFIASSHSGYRSSGLSSSGFHLACVYLSLSLLVIFNGCAEACHFPDFVQNSVNGSDNVRDWRGEIRNQNREVTLKYEFKNDVMQTTSSDPSIRSYSRICIQAYENNKFLVAHEEEEQISGRYTCVQVLQRSNFVIQIRQAELSSSLTGDLCSDNNLHLDGWLIIDTNSVMKQREDCSLNGGFNMQVYDKSTFTGVCDGYLGETRLESECLPGEGLNFFFRQAACVPDGLFMYPTQRTYCLANWEVEGFNFILLKHDRMTYMWLFRYPKVTEREKKFTALLMKDLYGSTESAITLTNQYLRLTMSRQSPKTLDHLCYDDYEICSVLSNPCSYSEEVARTCAKTCGFCSETKPTVCQLDSSIHGTLVDSNHPDDIPDVQINATTVDVSGTETLHCIDWTNGTVDFGKHMSTTPLENDQTREHMVVTVSDNGCRPRYSCAKFTKMTNLLFMQLSQTQLWPLVENKDDHYNCSNFLYTNNKDIDESPYRKRFPTLFVPNRQEFNVSFDSSEFVEFDVRFKGGIQCSGHLTQGPLNQTVQFFLYDCSAQLLDNVEFTFMEYALPFNTADNDTLLVTKTNNIVPVVHCWLFPEKPNNVFHMVASEDCNGAMKRKIRKGRLHPIATFTKSVPWTLVTDNDVIEEKTVNNLGPIQNITNDLNNIPDMSTVANMVVNSSNIIPHSDTYVPTTNATYNVSTVADDSKNPSPLVVFGIVITFISVQIGLYCNCA